MKWDDRDRDIDFLAVVIAAFVLAGAWLVLALLLLPQEQGKRPAAYKVLTPSPGAGERQAPCGGAR
jgi:hypothetical protein